MITRPLRIFAGALGAEVNTFAPLPINRERFAEVWLSRAGEIDPAEPAPLIAAQLRRIYELVESGEAELVQGLCAGAQPAGPITRNAYESLRDELLADLSAAGAVDIVIIGLHGATVADGYDDCDGDILARARNIIGEEVVLGGLLDPHCHMSETMLSMADLLFAYKEYPHTDIFQTADQLVDACVSCARGEIRPVVAAVDCRMIALLHTTRDPVASIVGELREAMKAPDVIDISIGHGFPWGDTRNTGVSVWATVHDDTQKAQALSDRFANRILDVRSDTATPTTPMEALPELISSSPPGLVVIADSADNPGGGAPSDSTYLLRFLLEAGFDDVVIGFIWDPGAVDLCKAAGIGSQISLRIGGKVGRMSGAPLDFDVRVERIVDSMFQEFGGGRWPMGATAFVSAGKTKIVLTSVRTQCFDAAVFDTLGAQLDQRRVAIVKSSQHFYASFSPRASAVYYVDEIGALGDFRQLPYTKLSRPIWPIDLNYVPQVQPVGRGLYRARRR